MVYVSQGTRDMLRRWACNLVILAAAAIAMLMVWPEAEQSSVMQVHAQTVPQGPNVNQSDGPPTLAFSKRLFYDVSNNLEYVCLAQSQSSRTTTLAVTGASNTTPITITTAVHGLASGAYVTIAGVGGTTAANGSWVVTVASTTTFSLNGSVGNGIYTSGGTATMTAPRTNMPQWSIQKFIYSGTNLSTVLWAKGSTGMNQVCDDRTLATTIYQ